MQWAKVFQKNRDGEDDISNVDAYSIESDATTLLLVLLHTSFAGIRTCSPGSIQWR